jgi:hypothetical protein
MMLPDSRDEAVLVTMSWWDADGNLIYQERFFKEEDGWFVRRFSEPALRSPRQSPPSSAQPRHERTDQPEQLSLEDAVDGMLEGR